LRVKRKREGYYLVELFLQKQHKSIETKVSASGEAEKRNNLNGKTYLHEPIFTHIDVHLYNHDCPSSIFL
jgi:hypothetical protein